MLIIVQSHQACVHTVQCLEAHTMLYVFYQDDRAEILQNLGTACKYAQYILTCIDFNHSVLLKHLKKFIVSIDGGFQVIRCILCQSYFCPVCRTVYLRVPFLHHSLNPNLFLFTYSSDLNHYASFITTLQQSSITPFFVALKEMGNVYIISTAIDVGLFIREAERLKGIQMCTSLCR